MCAFAYLCSCSHRCADYLQHVNHLHFNSWKTSKARTPAGDGGGWEVVCVCIRVCAFVYVRGTLPNLDEADDYDEREGQELGRGEEVLHSGGRLHAVAVHKGQQHCRRRRDRVRPPQNTQTLWSVC